MTCVFIYGNYNVESRPLLIGAGAMEADPAGAFPEMADRRDEMPCQAPIPPKKTYPDREIHTDTWK
jgi:hypothetical protein